MFEQDVDPVQVARLLTVSTKSAYQWRRRWRAGGPAALASRGAGGAVCRLDERQLARLRAALDAGPAASGWDEDQRWTLARAAALIARLFHVRYTLRGVSYLLHRTGFSPQVPAHRAAERDEAKITAWRARTSAKHEASGGDRSVDLLRGRGRAEPAPAEGPDLGPPGHTPVVKVCGKGSGRVSVAGLVCLKPGARGHLFYRVRIHRGRKGERRSMSEADYAELIAAARDSCTPRSS